MSNFNWKSDITKRREEARWKASLDQTNLENGRDVIESYRADQADLPLMIKRYAAMDIRECRRSRDEIADGLSRLLAKHITVAQIDAITAETKANRLPAEWLPAWVRVTGSTRVLDLIVGSSGHWLADNVERDLADLSRAELDRKRLEERICALRARVEKTVS